jgi:hypothetical protein
VPRFYFHIEGDGWRVSDEEGVEAANVDAARQAAVRAAADMAADGLRTGAGRVSERIVVADESGTALVAVTVDAALRIEGQR